MRLWTIHPEYLDTKGLLAVWREGLLAQKVLQNLTTGYRHHPQLKRFRSSPDPVAAIGDYLQGIYAESLRRGYRFAEHRIARTGLHNQISCTRGQLLYEWGHFLEKLRHRDAQRFEALQSIKVPAAHPLFVIIEGDIEDWEIRNETR